MSGQSKKRTWRAFIVPMALGLAATAFACGTKKSDPTPAATNSTVSTPTVNASASSSAARSASVAAQPPAGQVTEALADLKEGLLGAHGSSANERLVEDTVEEAAIADGKNPANDEENVAAVGNAAAPTKDAKDGGDFKIVVDPSWQKTPMRAKFDKALGILVDAFNKSLKLPRDIPIILRKCPKEGINAFYSPSDQHVVMCDEFMAFYEESFGAYKSKETVDETYVGAMMFFFLHEIGHCLIHQFDLPSTGREEDAADQLATLAFAGADPKVGKQMVLAGAEAFLALQTFARGGKTGTFFDEHSLDEQRFYNIVCLFFGKDPEHNKDLVLGGDLPIERARRCKGEWDKISKAWERLLKPHEK